MEGTRGAGEQGQGRKRRREERRPREEPTSAQLMEQLHQPVAIDEKDSDGHTSLMWAAYQGEFERSRSIILLQ